jgi:hypothetical protein
MLTAHDVLYYVPHIGPINTHQGHKSRITTTPCLRPGRSAPHARAPATNRPPAPAPPPPPPHRHRRPTAAICNHSFNLQPFLQHSFAPPQMTPICPGLTPFPQALHPPPLDIAGPSNLATRTSPSAAVTRSRSHHPTPPRRADLPCSSPNSSPSALPPPALSLPCARSPPSARLAGAKPLQAAGRRL